MFQTIKMDRSNVVPRRGDYYKLRSCRMKVAYSTWEAAEEAILFMSHKYGFNFHKYVCPFCKEYHIAKTWMPTVFRADDPTKFYTPPPETFLLNYRGSVAHNMYVPKNDPKHIDDIDLIGFCFGPPEHYLGLTEWGSRGTVEVKDDPYDVVLYEIRKAFSLLLQGNPNIMSVLWTHPQHHILTTDWSQRILDNKHLFLGKHVHTAFAGYANSQLLTRLSSFHKKGENIGYMGDKRKQLVLEHGYDSKNAAHLIRLLRMGIEFLETGEMQVYRVADREELLAIKRGEWKLEDIKSLSTELFEKAKQARDKSSLPAGPDLKGAEKLLVDILREKLK